MRLGSGRAAALALVLAAAPCRAAGPIIVEPVTGLPVKWDSSRPVLYNLETGRLNANISNAQGAQAIALAFQTWTNLPGVSLRVSPGTTIAMDITEGNVGTFLGKTDGLTPIVFDDTGKITDLVLGEGASDVVLGFATPEIVRPGTNQIVEGFACMNGKAMETESPESILNLMVHELGHMLGVGHSQLNGDLIFDGDAANNATIPVMFPILRSTSPDSPRLLPTPTLDDEVSMGFLYPSATYTSRGGNIGGRVLRAGAEFRGANVIARKLDDPRATAVSWPSGVSTLTGGAYETHLLPPGQYSVEVEPIDPTFTGGSSIGAFDPPPTGIPPEFFSAPNEVSDPTIDDPHQKTPVTVKAGQVAGGIDIVLNDSTVALNPGAETTKLIQKTGTIYETGGALPAFQYTVPIGDAASTLTITLVQKNGQPIDLFVRNAAAVSDGAGGTVLADASVTGTGDSKSLLLSRGTTPALKAGTYFVALVNRGTASADYTLTASFASPLTASTIGGTGSGGGCTMRRGATADEPVNALLLLSPLALVLVLRRRG